jgi:hypothetical protein
MQVKHDGAESKVFELAGGTTMHNGAFLNLPEAR